MAGTGFGERVRFDPRTLGTCSSGSALFTTPAGSMYSVIPRSTVQCHPEEQRDEGSYVRFSYCARYEPAAKLPHFRSEQVSMTELREWGQPLGTLPRPPERLCPEIFILQILPIPQSCSVLLTFPYAASRNVAHGLASRHGPHPPTGILGRERRFSGTLDRIT